MKISACKVLVSACLAASTAPAFADAHSSVTVNHVTVTLIDLDPNDGVAAGISFFPSPGKYAVGSALSGNVSTGLYGDPGYRQEIFNRTTAWPQSSLTGSASTPLASMSASVSGAATGFSFAGLSLAGNALSSPEQFGIFSGSVAVPTGGAIPALGYMLSANTQVIFSMDVSLDAYTTLGYTPGAAQGENASASIALYAAGFAADGTLTEDKQNRTVAVSYLDGTLPGGAADSWSGLFSASFSNLSNESSEGMFRADANILGQSVISAVPEPSTYGMLLGGLGVLGSLARRRKRIA